ncbi:MAG: LamG domain-containing protein [Acidobacteria bacterium]|nr:LamG domain-containing protein [Acidobacteriota bacterium]
MKTNQQIQLSNLWKSLSHNLYRFGAGAAILMIVALCSATSRAATFSPTTTAALINDLKTAEANGEDDVIYLSPYAVYKLTAADNGENGFPQITTKIRIVGNGAIIERDANAPTFRFFTVFYTGNLTLENLTLRGGKTVGWGGAAIYNLASEITLMGSVFENNLVDGKYVNACGGAVYNYMGKVTIDRSTFRNNTAPGGGGFASDGDSGAPPAANQVANVTINNSAFIYNSATIAYNGAGGMGGGFLLRGAHNADVSNVTVAYNKSAYIGGGVFLHTLAKEDSNNNLLHAKFTNLTIAQNRATSIAGGIYWTACGAYTCPIVLEPEVANTVIANNIAPSYKNYDTNHGFNSKGHNVLGPGIGSFLFGNATYNINGDVTGFTLDPTDKFITGSLSQLGGLSSTGVAGSDGLRPQAPVSTSLLIDKADPAFCSATDQLGLGRVGTCDIGAIEYRDCVAPPSDMTAWWPFDDYYFLEDFATWSFLNHANPNPNGPLQTSGMVGGAATFTNASHVLTVPSQNDINLFNYCAVDGGAAFSIDAWVKTSASGLQVILDKRQFGMTGIPRGYHLFLHNGRLGFQLADGISYANFITPSPTNLNDGQWHFIAVTIYVRCQRNGSAFEGKMYVDGNEVHQFQPGGLDYSNNAPLRIGGHSSSPALFFNGSLDEIEIFQRTLSGAEIKALYEAGWAGKCGKKTPPPCWPECK